MSVWPCVEACAEEDMAGVKRQLAETAADLEVEREARVRRETVERRERDGERREMHNMASEHNAAMLRDDLRVLEEQDR
jgi:hypothetical protein